ncbi:LON peptidase N-terminal domain and RING finger protein 3 [Rhynchospora pubera]|uniref:LON peptidase N-terminal domain and RING finger protein 3 n=1 Tax=Rhynchospora pubera TaxID=906938 RepID=A0AAV8CI57_9POAL|nr:LON peptidase N-terminal domain and RING finger protein 3 [Rhynchospora pubera]
MAHANSTLGDSSLDVDDFPLGEEGDDVGISKEKLDKVSALVRDANFKFRRNRYDEAISLYSKALLIKPEDHIILGNRSASFCLLTCLLKQRSATQSEYQPLNGLDPTTHAELALKDAEKIIRSSPTLPKSYLLKANALFLLERYQDAREALLEGLQIDPLDHHLQSCLRNLDQSTNVPLNLKQRKAERTDDFECTLCFKLLYEPVTTPCGHSFCRHCLHQAMDHSNKCPMCRTVLFITPRTYPISVVLNNIIQKNFPEEYAERKSEHGNVIYAGHDLMPLFVMDVVLPCQKLHLNIFEPRYRLMVRRVMEGNHRMGMVAIDPMTSTIAEFGCEIEIVECEPLPDGRFFLEIEGRRRFRIVESWDQDGYRIAQVEWFQDLPPPEGSTEKQELVEMASTAAELARNWITHAREVSRAGLMNSPGLNAGRRHRHLEQFESESTPGPNDPEKLSFWLLKLLNLRPFEKYELLCMKDTRERLSRVLDLLRAQEQGCSLQ